MLQLGRWAGLTILTVKKIGYIDCLVERVRLLRSVAHKGAIRIVFRFFVVKSERKNLLDVWAEIRETLKLILINLV